MDFKKAILSAVLVTSTGLILTTPVLAQSTGPSLSPSRKNLQQARQEVKEAQTDFKCAKVTARIDNHISSYNLKKDKHINQYTSIKNRVTNIINTLTTKGIDTAKLAADLIALDSKITKLSSDNLDFINKLEATKQYDCGDSKGAFKQAAQDTRAALKIVKADVLDIRNFVTKTIKPDIQKIRQQLKASSKPSISASTSAVLNQ